MMERFDTDVPLNEEERKAARDAMQKKEKENNAV